MLTDEVTSAEKLTLSNMLLNLANAGVIAPESDRAWMREMLGLPEAEERAAYPEWRLENSRSNGTGNDENNRVGT